MSLNRFYTPALNALSKQYAVGSSNGNFFHASSFLAGRSRKTEAKERAPPKGYRPPTPFSLVTKEVYKPGMTIPEVSKEASIKWKSLTPEQLKAYKDEADKIGEVRKKEFELLPEDEKYSLYLKQDTQRKIRKLKNQLQESLAASF